MKKNTGILLFYILNTFIATALNSWHYFLGLAITGLFLCIKEENSK